MPILRKRSRILGTRRLERASETVPGKTKAVDAFPTPTSAKQILEFAGLANFYRHFVPDFATVAEPLTRLTRKDAPFVWADPQRNAFNALKDALTTSPILTIYEEGRPIILNTDASGVGIGAILMQKDDDDALRVISYYSYKLNDCERKYSASELECLAVSRS